MDVAVGPSHKAFPENQVISSTLAALICYQPKIAATARPGLILHRDHQSDPTAFFNSGLSAKVAKPVLAANTANNRKKSCFGIFS